MTDERLDRWRDLMVAALYDELPPDERTQLEAELARDPALEREWRELEATRAWLAEAADTTTGGADLELVLPPRDAPRAWWQRPVLTAGAGFAAAASLFVALLLAGLRVDATDGGLLVRFETAGDGAVATASDAPVGPEVVARGGEPVTREEFARFADLLVQATSAQLDQLERRQSANQVQLVGALYDALTVDQRRQYDDLRTRLDTAVLQASLNEAAGAPGDRR
jgi:anti-sigma factor RsiW